MKTLQGRLITVIAMLVASLWMTGVSAQDKGTSATTSPDQGIDKPFYPKRAFRDQPCRMDPADDRGGHIRKGPRPMDLPDLTPEQQEKMKKAGLKHMSEMTPLKNQLREKRARLGTLMSSNPFNQTQADQVAEEIGKMASEILKAQIRHDREIRAILTPDQQVIFDARPRPWMKKQR